MAVTINGDGLVDVGGTSTSQGRVRLAEDTDNGTNYIELTAPASVASNKTITLPDATTTLVGTDTTDTLTNKTINGGTIQSATAQASTSGTSIDFTSLPSWVKRITVIFDNVSISGTANMLIQLGDSGGVQTTGYSSYGGFTGSSTGAFNSTAGIIISSGDASNFSNGHAVITNITSNTWIATTVFGIINGANYFVQMTGTKKSLSTVLDRVRITTTNGTDTFDSGNINIFYE